MDKGLTVPKWVLIRAVGGSENSGVPVLYGGHNLPPLVEIGLTDLPKFGGAMAPPAPPGTTGLSLFKKQLKRYKIINRLTWQK